MTLSVWYRQPWAKVLAKSDFGVLDGRLASRKACVREVAEVRRVIGDKSVVLPACLDDQDTRLAPSGALRGVPS